MIGSEPDPGVTLRDMLMEMRATVTLHLREDEQRWAAIQTELRGINGRISGMLIGTVAMLMAAVGALVIEFLGRVH